MFQSPVVRAILKGRELILGATPDDRARPRGLLAEVQSLGWAVLAEVPGREVVVGAVTRPWEPNVTFRAVAPGQFAAFAEPDRAAVSHRIFATDQSSRFFGRAQVFSFGVAPNARGDVPSVSAFARIFHALLRNFTRTERAIVRPASPALAFSWYEPCS